MRALLYIIVKSIKNRILELRHKPAALILYFLCIGGLVFVLVVAAMNPTKSGEQMDIIWLKGIYFAFVMIFVLISIQKGLSNGDNIFQMQDVNLLFVSPINPKHILAYGLIQMAKMAFLAGFCILFQSGTLSRLFGKGFDSLLVLYFNFIFTIVLLSLLSLVIYNITNGKPERKRAVRIVAVAVFAPLICYGMIQFLKTGDIILTLEKVLSSSIFAWTPVSGWNTEAMVCFISGSTMNGIFFTFVSILAGAVLLAYIVLCNPDYYEDVLVAAETAFDRKRSMDQGQANAEALSNSKVKVAKTGIGGYGVNSIFFKHFRETTRANSLGLLTRSTVYMTIGAAVISLFMKDGSMSILQIIMWMQIFMIGNGRGMKEITMHYIYMIPETSFKKIIWSNIESTFVALIQSILIFGISGIIAGAPPLIILGSIIVFTAFSLMLIGINYLFMRCFDVNMNAGILITIYIMAVILLMLPGLILAVAIGAIFGSSWGVFVALTALTAWEFFVALVCFGLSKGVLHSCDIQVRSK